MLKYAFAHPGKIGDFLYILPTVKLICERDGAVADIYTSDMCKSTESLIIYQSYVNDFIIPQEYEMVHFNQGVQPWQMPIDESKYDKVYQLGFEHFPHGPLHHYIAKSAGLDTVPDPQYEYPDKVFSTEPYVVIAHCGYHTSHNLRDAYRYFIEHCPLKTIQAGAARDGVIPAREHDQLGIDFLDLASLISKAKAYIGFYSGQLAVANGFPGLLKIITSSRSGGEGHGLYIPETINVSEAFGPDMIKIFVDNMK
jgi:hypothetical protein